MSEVRVLVDHLISAKVIGPNTYLVGYSFGALTPINLTTDNVIGEVPAGALNGINATYTTAYDFVPETVEVFLNGVRQKVVDDYNTSGTTQILFGVSPGTGEKILINYKKQ